MKPIQKTDLFFLAFCESTKKAMEKYFKNIRIIETNDMLIIETRDKKKLVITANIT